MAVMSVATFERFFRSVADLDVDRSDFKRYGEFVRRKVHDLLIMAEATAKANERDVIEPRDLPITKGLQESIHAFRRLAEAGSFRLILQDLALVPQLDLAVGAETEAGLPDIAGGLSVALGQAFQIIDPELPNPQSVHWERAFRLFDLLM
jgi:hypothetical protein